MQHYTYRGYDISRGGFAGTCDDRRDRWYVTAPEADYLDRRGPGYRTLAEAKQAIRDMEAEND